MVLNKQLTFLDLFSGIGGFKIALERAGFKSIGFCDNDEYANKLYRAYFKNDKELFYDDIRKINTSNNVHSFPVLRYSEELRIK